MELWRKPTIERQSQSIAEERGGWLLMTQKRLQSDIDRGGVQLKCFIAIREGSRKPIKVCRRKEAILRNLWEISIDDCCFWVFNPERVKEKGFSSRMAGNMGKTLQLSGFPINADANRVKDFLEKYAGVGSVYALKFRLPKNVKRTSRAYVVVQFLTSDQAEKIFLLAEQRTMFYGGSYLTVRLMERDIVPKPKESLRVIENTELYCGNLISKETFSSLWRAKNAEVHFGFNMRKLQFFVSTEHQSYKLELSYESIWEIQLRTPLPRIYKYLLIQVIAAPRIFEMPTRNSSLVFEDPKFNYFKDEPDDQWVRTMDFTPNCSIGQSSAICLKVPDSCNLPNIREYFVYYKNDNGPFYLESGSSYSRSLDLVPIVGPRPGIDVPYKILFKINHMVQNGTLMGQTLDDEFFWLACPNFVSVSYIEHALEKMSYLKSTCFQPANWLREQYKSFEVTKRQLKSPTISLDAGLVYVHRVQVTPSKLYFYGPEINVSNRVLRHYSKDLDNFIRVSFVDEDCEKMRSTDLSLRSPSPDGERRTTLYKRILSTLRKGITVGDKKFEFLAFSSSQLRENSVWMFSSRRGLTATDIRNWMGDFRKIRNVAKYAARLGQSFGSSTETLTVERYEIEIIPDIENASQYLFSDGIGKLSAEFARKVAAKCNLESSIPSAYQIRYGGYKGVVAVDPTSSKKLSLRNSMSKYDSDNTKLDVLAYSKYQPCYLNRQLITLLSTLGVRDHMFERKQEDAVERLDKILTDPVIAREAIDVMSPGETTNVLKELLLCNYKPDAEPFVSMLLQTFRATKLLELRMKSRIFVPEGRTMMGCLDETRTLDYGQVFVQVSYTGSTQFVSGGLLAFGESETSHAAVVIKGKVVVAKNPCLHPGDVRTLVAVDVPRLHHMVDCVVFPQKGKRPHPNECSGSDLDGDLYFVSWDSALIPPREVQPMEYTAAPTETLDHEVTIEEVQEYFTNYIVNDSLGIIANAHTVFADKEPRKAESEPCLRLAELFSIAVDFPKTGVAAVIPAELQVREYPDFMEKLDKVTYESKGVIGKLFRAIKDRTVNSGHIKTFTKEVARQAYDRDMEVDGFMDYLSEALWFKGEYDFKLGNLMDHYGIKTEAEILSGSIMKMTKTFTKYKDGEAIRLAVRSLRKEARTWFKEKSNDNGESEDDLFAKASAWYHVTYHADYWGRYHPDLKRPHFLSFPWCVYDNLVQIKRNRIMRRKVSEAELHDRFGGLRIR